MRVPGTASTRLVIGLILVLALSSCDGANDLWRRWFSGEPEVLNSRIVSGIGVQSAFWIDNERVILMGIQEESYQDQRAAVDTREQPLTVVSKSASTAASTSGTWPKTRSRPSANTCGLIGFATTTGVFSG